MEVPKAKSRPSTPLWDDSRGGLVFPWVWCKASQEGRRWVEVTLPEKSISHGKIITKKMMSESWTEGISTKMTRNPWTGTRGDSRHVYRLSRSPLQYWSQGSFQGS